MLLKEIWTALTNGETLTDGEIFVEYRDGELANVDGSELFTIPFNKDNAENWSIFDKSTLGEPLYYQWVYVDPTYIKLSDTLYHEDITPTDGWELYGEGYTKAEILKPIEGELT